MPYIAFKRAKSAITQEEGFLISSLRAKKDLTNPVHKVKDCEIYVLSLKQFQSFDLRALKMHQRK